MKTKTISSFVIVLLFLSFISNSSIAQEVHQVGTQASTVAALINPPWTTDWVDSTSDEKAGSYPSIAFNPLNGQPYISYYDSTDKNLMLAKPYAPGEVSLCPEKKKWTCVLVDGEVSNVGKFSSLAFYHYGDILKMGISYYDDDLRALRFAEFTPPDNWTIQLIELPGLESLAFGWYTSLKYNKYGMASIAYYVSNSTGDDEIKYAENVLGNGNCGSGNAFKLWGCQIVDSGDRVGMYSSLDIGWDGTIYIAYYDGAAGNLKFRMSHQYAPDTVAGASADVGMFAAMLAPHKSGESFRIAFYDKTHGRLMLASWGGPGNPCDIDAIWDCVTIDNIGANLPQVGISATYDRAGYPLIAYMNAFYEDGPSRLYIARPAPAIGEETGNCGDVPPGDLFQVWLCQSLDSAGYGYGDVSVADYTSVAVNSYGLAAIAYREVNYMEQTTALKIAYQQPPIFLPVVNRGH
jgi:hypothetical protein